MSNLIRRLEDHWLVTLGEILGKLAIFFAIIMWLAEAGDRKIQAQHRAWNVLISASGMSGNYGRKRALQELHEEGISLEGVDLSHALLSDLSLHKARMSESSFVQADLSRASFVGTKFNRADFTLADIKGVDFTNAELRCTLFCEADMGADKNGPLVLKGANIKYADFTGARSLDCEQILSAENHETALLPEGQECGGFNENRRKKILAERLETCASIRPGGCLQTEDIPSRR